MLLACKALAMASVVARRVLATRVPALQSAAKIHTFSGALSGSTMKVKPGGANGYLDTVHKVMPEISEILEGTWAATKGVVSCMSFSSVPQSSSMCGFNVFQDLETIQKVRPKAGQVYAKFADHLDLSVEPHRETAEADIIDFGVLKPADKYQPAVLLLAEFPTKPEAARPWVQKFLANEGMRKQMHEQDFGMASEIITYPTESSMHFRIVFKDFDAYIHFRSAAVQEKFAVLWAESGFTEILTGAPIGRTVFPDAHVLVR